MEKVPLTNSSLDGLQSPSYHSETRKAVSRKGLLFKATVVSLVALVWIGARHLPFGIKSHRAIHVGQQELDFEEITPSEKLQWHPCRGEFLCARLTVPMDYHRPLNASPEHPKVHIALLMAPGKNDGPKKFSTSPLLINPGGPGGSGTMVVQFLGTHIQNIVNSGQDVIGFDPRGIGSTTPRIDCFSYSPYRTREDPSDQERNEDYITGLYNRWAWQVSGRATGLINSSAAALPKLDARARAVAKLCQEKDSISGKDSIFKYAHTPSVARDMLSIVDAWDEWKDSLNSCDQAPLNALDTKSTRDHDSTHSLDTKGKLVYWGFSYGTLLGATFASMFSDRVGRVLLDGVVDADHYVGPVWTGSLRDTDTIFNSFSKYCFDGEEACALYRKGDKQSDIEQRFKGVISDLAESPITFVNPESHNPIVVTIDDLKLVLFQTLYSPMSGFPLLAMLFDALTKGDHSVIQYAFDNPPLELFCSSMIPRWAVPNEAQLGIMCSDKRYPLNETVPNLEVMYEKMSKISIFSDVWMGLMMGCDGYGVVPVDPPMKWDSLHKLKPINTSFPLMFISNTADPVTPLHAGLKMARKFVDAGLLEQKSMGHCSLAAASKCTVGKIRKYFEGEVPPPPTQVNAVEIESDKGTWEKCEADEQPFQPYQKMPGVSEITENYLEAQVEGEAMKSMKEIQKYFKDFQFFGLKGRGFDIGQINNARR